MGGGESGSGAKAGGKAAGEAWDGLKLSSPSAGEPIVYDWPLTKTDTYDAAGEIIESIRFVSDEHRELKLVMEKVVMISRTDTRSYDAMRHLCEQFSKAAETIRRLWHNQTRPDNPAQARASTKLLKHVVQQCYNRSVLEPKRLNHYYDAFSPETYGETSFSMLERILERVEPKAKDVFLDLGSGVGQVVLYMAGGSQFRKVIGIEKADLPASYAQTMQSEFKRWMKWYGKRYQQFQLLKGNFLDPAFRELILKEATVIFVNNYAFGPDLDHKLKRIFAELKDGVRIISSRSFCGSSDRRMSDRMMNDVSAMLDVEELSAPGTSVSWTCKSVPYFLHTVDRKRLETYFFAQRAAATASGPVERKERKSSSKSSSRESSRSRELPKEHRELPAHGLGSQGCDNQRKEGRKARASVAQSPAASPSGPPKEQSSFAQGGGGDNVPLYGPTTRRQWTEWVSKTHTSDKQSSSTASSSRREKESSLAPVAKKRKVSAAKEEDLVAVKPPPPRSPVKYASSDSSNEQTSSGKVKRKASVGQRARPGRPRKTEPKSPLHKSSASSEALNILHAETMRAVREEREAPPGAVEVADLIRAGPAPPMSWIPLSGDEGDDEEPATDLSPDVAQALDAHVDSLKKNYRTLLLRMHTSDFRKELMDEVSRETSRREELREKKALLEKQLDGLKAEGVRKLEARIAELNLPVPARTPAQLLNQSKEIVETHSRLKVHHSGLQAEVLQLESRHRALLAGLATQSDPSSLLAHLGAFQGMSQGLGQGIGHPFSDPNALSAAKEAVINQLQLHYRRNKSLAMELSRVQSEVMNLQAQLPPQVIQLVDSVFPAPPLPVPGPQMGAPASVAHSQAANGPPTHPALPATATQAAKPKRTRNPKGTPRKRPSAAAAAANVPVPPSQPAAAADGTGSAAASAPAPGNLKSSPEEIERQIQDIVAKALSVDSAAKSAEKERRQAKSGERKGRAKPPAPRRPPNAQHLPVAHHLPHIPDASAAPAPPTFSSPGLVPVFVPDSAPGAPPVAGPAPGPQAPPQPPGLGATKTEPSVVPPAGQRSHSGSSAETESVPSPAAAFPGLQDAKAAAAAAARPASLPQPQGRTGSPAVARPTSANPQPPALPAAHAKIEPAT